MTSSLVGSEMCIRDSLNPPSLFLQHPIISASLLLCSETAAAGTGSSSAVSYTHLTLPTICSV
eukprot:726933-Prorocentrum_lima.AAC.1